MNIVKRAIRKTRFLWSYSRSLVCGFRNRGKFRDVKRFLVFVGYPRSGHSLIASLIDAHPNTLISMEWGALSYFKMGYSKLQIYSTIERFSRIFTERLNNKWTGYSYRVEGQFQGRSDHPIVMGDKLGGQTSLVLRKEPELMDQLKNEVGELRIIHVIRNPYDTISTMRKRSMENPDSPGNSERLDYFTHRYFERVEVVDKLKKSGKYQILDVYHEAFIDDPANGLKTIMNFLKLDVSEEYIKDCSEIVFENPHQSRLEANWSEDQIATVQSRMDSVDFLSGYSFES